jgi:hypothetical protein
MSKSGLFLSPKIQIQRVTPIATRYRNFWVPGTPTIPEVPHFEPQTETEVLMLVPYLPDSGTMQGLQRTFDVGWNLIKPPKRRTKDRWDDLDSSPGNLRLICDDRHLKKQPVKIVYQQGFRWVGFDPNANQGKSPRWCWDNPRPGFALASSEVLFAAWLFSRWVARWDGKSWPFPIMGGFQGLNGVNWGLCPYMCTWTEPDLLKLSLYWADEADPRFAIPTIRLL